MPACSRSRAFSEPRCCDPRSIDVASLVRARRPRGSLQQLRSAEPAATHRRANPRGQRHFCTCHPAVCLQGWLYAGSNMRGALWSPDWWLVSGVAVVLALRASGITRVGTHHVNRAVLHYDARASLRGCGPLRRPARSRIACG